MLRVVTQAERAACLPNFAGNEWERVSYFVTRDREERRVRHWLLRIHRLPERERERESSLQRIFPF